MMTGNLDLASGFLAAAGKDAALASDAAQVDAAIHEVLAGTPDDALAVETARLLAELAKDESRRYGFKAPVMQALGAIYLRDSLAPADRHQVHRAMCNLCAEHEDMRDALLELEDVLSAVAKNIDADFASAEDEGFTFAMSGIALLVNFAIEYPAGQKKLVDMQIVPRLLKKLRKSNPLATVFLHLITVIAQHEEGRDALVSERGIDQLVDLLQSSATTEDEHLLYIIETLEVASEDNAIVQKRLHARKVLNTVLRLMEDFVNAEINSDDDDNTAAIDSCLRIVVNLTHDDEVVAALVADKEVLGKFHGWMTYPDEILSSKAAELVVCAALCLGNIARSDANSTALVQDHSFAKDLMHILGVVSNAKVHLASLSALRHFAMPAANKALLGQLSVTEAVMPYMLSPVADVALTATVINRLLSSEERNMRAIVTSNHNTLHKTALAVALECYAKHSDQAAIKCEVGRLVGSLIKGAVNFQADDCLEAIREQAMHPLWQLLHLPYEVVYNEAVVALMLVLGKSANAAAVEVPDSFASAAAKLLAPSNAIEFRLNAVQLILVIQSQHPEWAGRFTAARDEAVLSTMSTEGVKLDQLELYKKLLAQIA
ncbi:Rap1 GTPase-GDP dissociation stimulator 1 [Blastocladiella emersonii ATCC 22665]|nr:Rap1 GTPase-GDP dissociation stimulator 1 [Blastocladiella emersonii ATCC 22665]